MSDLLRLERRIHSAGKGRQGSDLGDVVGKALGVGSGKAERAEDNGEKLLNHFAGGREGKARGGKLI